MKVKPLGNRILVKPLTTEEVTASGIILPDTADKEKKTQGEIVALGNGSDIEKLGLKIGDKVVFGKYSGDEIEVEEAGQTVEYKVLNVGEEKDESDVLAVIE
ncbi:MAG TPA: co-chaperone GroES [Candidatus Doudnabacteria bacterium]|nr:co-chaperone GroES [Candidatus Doudnabacteria bacterium]